MEFDRFRFLEFEDQPTSTPIPDEGASLEETAANPSGASPRETVELQVVEVIGAPGMEVGEFRCPKGLAIDADGALYVADSLNKRLQRIALNGDVVRFEPFLEPQAVAVHPQGQGLFVADLGDHCVYGLDRTGRRFRRLSGFVNPLDIVFDVEGFLWVADTGNGRIVRLHPYTGDCIVSIGRERGLVHPVALAFDSTGALYVADDYLGTIVRFTANTPPVSVLTGVHRIREKGQFALDLQGRIYLADPANDRVVVFSSQGEALATLRLLPGRLGTLHAPTGLVLEPNYQGFYVSDTQNHRLLRVVLQPSRP
ncbi:NHL repeat protein [Chthonomonas calidirosea]|nr:NHL repeat protein [Chthonomonas calidirosea]